MSTLVFLPAWNEEQNLPAVLDELAQQLPGAELLVVDDGSTDRTAEVAKEHGAEVVSFGVNRGLPAGIAAGYEYALEHGYDLCGRVDADGQHPVAELRRLIAEVQEGRCDVAVGSRYLHGDDHQPHRYRLEGARRFGTAVARRAVGVVLRRPFHDPMSGMWAVGAAATELLSRPYTSGAPEVEALMRVTGAGLRLEEMPVEMRPRASGESKLQGKKAVGLVVTVAGTLIVGWRLMRRRR
ncbi:MAG TPA: glycosyltransferase family 2 protein [Gaiellaceae bacterium]